MKKIIAYLTVLAVIVLVAGTVVEKIYGSTFALSHIYHSIWFAFLWWIWSIFIIIYLVINKTYKNWKIFTFYLSFLFIIAGMTLTTFTAQKGKLTLQKAVPVSSFIPSQEENNPQLLPFSVELDTFQIITHHGTSAPQDFVSKVHFSHADGTTKSAMISMNHIARYKGYRFYLSGYDHSGQVMLTVTHDPWGIGLTYLSYLLSLCSALLLLFDRRSHLRRMWRQLSHYNATWLFAALMVLCTLPLQGSPVSHRQPRTLPKESANKMGQIYVLHNNRICPLQTLAQDFTTKLYGAPTYKGLSSEQVLSGWIFYFSDWCKEPIFKIKGNEVRSALGIKGKYASLMDFNDEFGQYKLNTPLDTMDLRSPKRSDFLAADEKYNLIVMLYSGELLKIFPVADTTGMLQWHSQSDPLPLHINDKEYAFIRYYISYSQELVMLNDLNSLNELWSKTIEYQNYKAKEVVPGHWKSNIERWYNRYTVGRSEATLCILIGLLFFAYALFCIGKGQSSSRKMRWIGITALTLLTTYLLVLFIVRWYVSGHIPMGNGYETMLFLALCMSVLGILFGWRHPLFLSGGLLLTGFAMLGATIGGASSTITHLMPVLSSPLLCLHVTVIMTAYALLAFIMLNGVAALVANTASQIRQKQPAHKTLRRLQLTSHLMLYPALFLLALGIIIGAVWANISWGTYWSWDPKEVWALITLLIYALPLHSHLFPRFRQAHFFHLYTILAFFTVLFTYFGVNLLLGGMHSYM